MHPSVRQLVLGGSKFPGAYNVQGAWLAQLKANWPTKDILMLGDSTTRGNGAGEGGTAWVNAFNHSVPAVLAQLLAARGYTTRADAWHGDGEGVTGLIADFQVHNANNVVGASWVIQISPAEGVGGALVHDNSGSSLMSLTATNCDRFLIEYRRSGGNASFQIDSETAVSYNVASITNADDATGIQQAIVTSGAGVGTHTLNISRASATDCIILGVEPRRSAGGEKRILNLGRTANSAGLAANTATHTSPIPSLRAVMLQRTAPLVMINLGINDQNSGVSTDNYKIAMQVLISTIVAAGGIPMLVGHHPTSTTPSAAYIQARQELAATNGIPYLDLTYYFPTWAGLQAAGFTFDGSSHLNAPGYAALAAVIDRCLAWMVH